MELKGSPQKKCKVLPARDYKASVGSRGTAPLILKLGIWWNRGVNFTLQAALPQYH
jgi:hypothetical protein